MIIGIDFDNTIVCYDGLFHAVAVERGWINADVSKTKTAVRDHLRQRGEEELWTELQGHIYGVAIERAKPFDGVIAFLVECRKRSLPVSIVSHRTRKPYLGPKVDLHAAARNWIAANLVDESEPLIDAGNIHFESTRIAKMKRIASLGCTHFIDDLPEFLSDPNFPANSERLWFAADVRSSSHNELRRYESWGDIMNSLLP